MGAALKNRAKHWHAIFRRSIWQVIAAFFGVAGALSFVRDEFLSPEWQAKLKMPRWLPAWPWYWWVISALVCVIIAIMEGSYREYRSLSERVGKTATTDPKRQPEIEICFYRRSPYEEIEVSHGRTLSTVRIGIKNSGGGALSNCKVSIDKIAPEPAIPGGLPILLSGAGFTVRHDDPEKVIDIASHWDHADKFRFSAPLSPGFAEAQGYIPSQPSRTIAIKIVATERQRSATFRIWADEKRALHLEFIGYVN